MEFQTNYQLTPHERKCTARALEAVMRGNSDGSSVNSAAFWTRKTTFAVFREDGLFRCRITGRERDVTFTLRAE